MEKTSSLTHLLSLAIFKIQMQRHFYGNYLKYDFLRSYLFKNEPHPFLSSKLDSPVVKTLEKHFFTSLSLQCFDYRRI